MRRSLVQAFSVAAPLCRGPPRSRHGDRAPRLQVGTHLRCVPLFAALLRKAAPSYLTSTFAPAASTFFLISSASCLVTPSLMGLGAPSTNALASAKPRPGTAPRTSLITA